MAVPCGAEQGAWLEQLRLQIPWQSLPNNAVSQGLECKEMLCVDSLGREWGGRRCGAGCIMEGLLQADTALCLPQLLVPGSR